MKLKIYADRTYILNQIREIAGEIEEEHKQSSYSSVIETAISELIKIEMRELAHRDQPDPWYSGERILFQAIDSVRNNLLAVKPGFDFSEYFKAAERKLRAPAMELSDLRTKLRASKELARIGQETSVEGLQAYQIKELGLTGAIEGLLIYPLSDVVEIDLDRLRDAYMVEGEWFPYQVKSHDFTFVIDDDGSIFTSTEHFSDRMILDAKQILKKIADNLYS